MPLLQREIGHGYDPAALSLHARATCDVPASGSHTHWPHAMKKILAAAVISIICSCQSQTNMNVDKANEFLTALVENNRTPSVQYIHFDRNRILKSFHRGYSDIARHKKPDSATTYHVFSVTKTFTALAVLQLQEKGKLDINDPVIHYLPDFPYGREITIKQLMTHSAGIPNPIPLSWIHLERDHDSFDRDAFFKGVFEKNADVNALPNERFAYSNLGYLILGKLIEHASGETYEKYVTENIIQKLSLRADDLSFSICNDENHAKGYHNKWSFSYLLLGMYIDKSVFMDGSEGKWRCFNAYCVNGAPYGGLIGTPAALVKYVQALLKNDGTLVGERTIPLLFRENENNAGEPTGMCLAWFTGELNGKKYFTHAGGGGGYYCEIRIYPDLGKGSVIFFNRTGMSNERILDKVDTYVLND